MLLQVKLAHSQHVEKRRDRKDFINVDPINRTLFSEK